MSSIVEMLRYCFFIIFFVISLESAKGVSEFIDVIGDVPVIPGMEIIDKSITSFDTPDGRIIEVYGSVKNSKSYVEQFYNEVLLSLGWKKESSWMFSRSGELLIIDFIVRSSNNLVRFTIMPQ